MSLKRHNYILLIIAAVLLLAAVFQRLSIKKYTVQNFKGTSYNEVIKWMETNSVPEENVVFSYIYSETVPEGTVISQNITANHLISGNNSLVVTISKGSDPDYRITLIDFNEMDEKAITAWFDDNRIYNYQFVYEINEKKPEDKFLSSTPVQGTRIKRDEPVIITMCIHDHSTTVVFPDFTDQTVSEIQTWADENEITVNFIYYFDASESGTFLFSDIPAGTEIEKGESLSIAVSAGPGA